MSEPTKWRCEYCDHETTSPVQRDCPKKPVNYHCNYIPEDDGIPNPPIERKVKP